LLNETSFLYNRLVPVFVFVVVVVVIVVVIVVVDIVVVVVVVVIVVLVVVLVVKAIIKKGIYHFETYPPSKFTKKNPNQNHNQHPLLLTHR